MDEDGPAPDDEQLPDEPSADDAGDEMAGLFDPDLPVSPGAHTALPPKIEAWRRRSAAGAILTGFALGLQEALEKRKEEPGIIMETSGDPPRDLPVEADFEYGRPRNSVVQIRPWLLKEGEAADEPAAEDPGRPDPDK